MSTSDLYRVSRTKATHIESFRNGHGTGCWKSSIQRRMKTFLSRLYLPFRSYRMVAVISYCWTWQEMIRCLERSAGRPFSGWPTRITIVVWPR